MVLASLVAVCVLVSGLTAQQIWHSRTADLDDAARQTINLAHSLSQQANDSFQTGDGVLQELVDDVQVDGIKPAAVRRLHSVMVNHVDDLHALRNLIIIDAHGNCVTSAIRFPKTFNGRELAYFEYHRTHVDLNSLVGRVIHSRTDGSLVITITRRVNHPDGSFAGVVAATLSADYYLQLYKRVDVGRSGSITLALDGGTVLMRKPAQSADGAERGPTRLFASERLSQYPLVVVVAVGKDEVLEHWRAETMISLLELFAMLGFVGFIGVYLTGEIGKRESAEAQLEHLVLTDSLTGLGNRHQFDAVLTREWRRASRAGTPLAFLMIDADTFKSYNDKYGHQAGDDVLRTIASCISGSLGRPGDLAARYGGEEFAVFLPETDAAGGYAVAETIRNAVVARNIAHSGTVRGIVTVSIGVGCMSPNSSALPSSLVKEADSALYDAKSKGRNRTERARAAVPILEGVLAQTA